jgi:LysR family transcriptional regulator for bpeEF and oprC
MEDELGTRLLHRSTRSVTLTNEGADFLDRCRAILADIDEAEGSVRGVMSKPRGKLRVVLPVGLGHKVIVPALRKMAKEYPDLTIDCELTDRVPDLIYERLDCAVLIGPISDLRLVARRLYDLRFFPCASPEYLRIHGEPQEPEDLDRHNCITYVLPQTGKYREWRFQRDGIEFTKVVSGQVNYNYGLSMVEAGVEGEGVVLLSTFMMDEARRNGRLKVLMKPYAAVGPSVWLVYPERRYMSAKVRLFAEFVSSLFPAVPPWDAWVGVEQAGP